MIIVFGLVAFGVVVGVCAFWVWMIIECATKEPSEGNDKLIWILVILLLNWLGALIYYFARRPTRMRLYGR